MGLLSLTMLFGDLLDMFVSFECLSCGTDFLGSDEEGEALLWPFDGIKDFDTKKRKYLAKRLNAQIENKTKKTQVYIWLCNKLRITTTKSTHDSFASSLKMV